MADKTATVRLEIKNSGFRNGLKDSEKASNESAAKMGQGLSSALSNGAKGGLDAFKSLFSSIKSGFATVGSIIGAVGIAELVRGTVDAQQRFKQLATNITLGTQQLVNWRDLQKDVNRAALATNNTIDGMTDGLEAVFGQTGDKNFALESLEAIGHVAKQTGSEVGTVGKIAGVLQQKFGIAGPQIGDALTQVVAAANQGGASLEDLADDLGEIGGKAKTLGAVGPEGLRQMLGFLNLAKEEAGNFQQAMTALPQIFDQIIERTSKGKIVSSGRIPLKVQAVDNNGNPRPFPEIIADIIQKTKGDAAALGEFGFGGEGLQTILALAKDFEASVKMSGGNVDQAKALFANRLQQAAGATANYQQILDAAAEKTPADKIQEAMTRIQLALAKPEAIAAIESLAGNLPALAEAVTKAIAFVVDSPMTAGALYAGGTFAMGGMQSMLEGAFQGGGKQAGNAIGNSMKEAGGSVATNLGNVVAAFGLAVVAWAAAVEQFDKLSKEWDGEFDDREDARALEIAEASGKSYATREKTPLEQLVDSPLGGGDDEVIVRGEDGKAKRVSMMEHVAKQRREGDRPIETLDGEIDPDAPGVWKLPTEIKLPKPAAPAPPPMMFGTGEAWNGPPGGQSKPVKAEVDPNAIASAMTSRTIRVDARITNPEAIGTSKADGRGPAPGPTPRR